jgi:hypothetical protein
MQILRGGHCRVRQGSCNTGQAGAKRTALPVEMVGLNRATQALGGTANSALGFDLSPEPDDPAPLDGSVNTVSGGGGKRLQRSSSVALHRKKSRPASGTTLPQFNSHGGLRKATMSRDGPAPLSSGRGRPSPQLHPNSIPQHYGRSEVYNLIIINVLQPTVTGHVGWMRSREEDTMGKLFVLLLIILLALASVGGFVYLTVKITSGEKQIASGQKQLKEGQQRLKEGKARLDTGKQELSEAKTAYGLASPFLSSEDKALTGGLLSREAGKRIAEGDKQVASGESQVKAGEKRLAAGELELSRGKEQLRLAKDARLACAIAAVIFAPLSIVLAFRWKRSLGRNLTPAGA